MIGRRAAVIGLVLLSALLFAAFAAQSASAQKEGVKEVKKSENTTAFTCVKGEGTLDFNDAHCDEKVVKGEFGHVAITKGVSTKLEITNEKTKNSESGKTDLSTPATLKGTLAGTEIHIACKKVKSVEENSFIENTETNGKHTVSGTVEVQFSECETKKPAAPCEVEEPIVTTAKFQGVEGVRSPGGKKEEMGVEFKGVGAEEIFATLKFKPEAPKCSIGTPTEFPVKGSVIATGTPVPSKANKHSGATSVYIPHAVKATAAQLEEEMQTLSIGGNKEQFFEGTFTTNMSGKGNPITLTTVT
jgi:hypothetical protein